MTARVWDIADQITREIGRKAPRKDVVERYVAEGGNANTASTQYHHWRKAFGDEPGVASDVDPVRITIAADGRVLIPAELRRAMQVDASGSAMARVVDGELRILSLRCALTQAQDRIRAFDVGEGSPVDELLRERRAEPGRE